MHIFKKFSKVQNFQKFSKFVRSFSKSFHGTLLFTYRFFRTRKSRKYDFHFMREDETRLTQHPLGLHCQKSQTTSIKTRVFFFFGQTICITKRMQRKAFLLELLPRAILDFLESFNLNWYRSRLWMCNHLVCLRTTIDN